MMVNQDLTTEDCMAGKIAATVMRQLGFREPLKHPKWQVIADEVQKIIDAHMEAMTRIAKLDSQPRTWGEWMRSWVFNSSRDSDLIQDVDKRRARMCNGNQPL